MCDSNVLRSTGAIYYSVLMLVLRKKKYLQDIIRTSVLQEVQREEEEIRRRSNYKIFGSATANTSCNDAVKNVSKR